MKRSDIHPMPEYFDRYIFNAADVELEEAFINSLHQLDLLDRTAMEAVGNKVYAPDKWTIPDIVQHITDTERVFAYRALRFARNDATRLHGFDQDLFADNAHAVKRDLSDLLEELKLVRQTTIMLFNSFNDVMLLRQGFCYKGDMSVLAIGFTIIGHQEHHLAIIKEKYLPLAEKK